MNSFNAIKNSNEHQILNDKIKRYDAVKYKAPTGTQLSCKVWIQEATLRMLNNLNPKVAEKPYELIVWRLSITYYRTI